MVVMDPPSFRGSVTDPHRADARRRDDAPLPPLPTQYIHERPVHSAATVTHSSALTGTVVQRRICQRSPRVSVAALLVATATIWPLSLSGQTTTPSADRLQQTTTSTSGFQDGFFVQSSDGEYRLVIGLVAQADGRFSLDDPKPIINTFTLRKLRPTFSGRIARYFDFKVMPDFGNGTTLVQDAYLDIRFSPALRVRSGKDKTPVGYELLQGDAFLWFPERSLASSLVPNRDIGVQLQGDLTRARLSYAAGVFNGIPDASSSTTEVDTNNSKDFAGRVIAQPFRRAGGPTTAISGLGFHLGASGGRQSGALPSFRTSVGQIYFSYRPDAFANGVRTRVSPAAFYYFKSFGTFAEFMRSSQPVIRQGVVTDVSNHAWHVTASMFLTGEAAAYGAIRPRRNFDPAQNHWGALQLLARYSALTADRAVATGDLMSPTSSRRARSFTAAANWYPNAYIKYYATFERTVFDQETIAARPAENIILIRTQIGF
jgi:phosphate-selective porin OprO and OprP